MNTLHVDIFTHFAADSSTKASTHPGTNAGTHVDLAFAGKSSKACGSKDKEDAVELFDILDTRCDVDAQTLAVDDTKAESRAVMF